MELPAKRIETFLEFRFGYLQLSGEIKKLEMINFWTKSLDLAALGAEMSGRDLCTTMRTGTGENPSAVCYGFSHLICSVALLLVCILSATKKMVESLRELQPSMSAKIRL
jgi:hypothetical protein